MEFAEKMARPKGCALGPYSEGCAQRSHLFACARNHALDYLRSLNRRRIHEVVWPEATGSDGENPAWDCPDDGPNPEEQMMREEFWQQVGSALSDLTSLERSVFLRHYLDGQSIKDLAAALDTTEGAASQLLYRARRRLRARLEERGVTEADLRSLIALLPRTFQSPRLNPFDADDE